MKAVLIPGDGIGREIAESVREVSAARNTGIEWQEFAAGAEYAAESGELMDVSFTAENSGDLRVEAAVHFTDALAPVIPDDVLTAIHSGSNDDASTLTDNALRLLGAWGELTADDLSADIALSADCGPMC